MPIVRGDTYKVAVIVVEKHQETRSVGEEERDRIPLTEAFPCPYLPGRLSQSEVYAADGLTPDMYETLMTLGFRRSGRIVYRPVCADCSECRQLRVPVATFRRSKSMRRVWRRNVDVSVSIQKPEPDEARYQLFRRYLNHQHDGTMARTYQAFTNFLYDSPMESVEFTYHVGDRMVAVSIADNCEDGISSVYVYFDPEFRERSLGVFSALWEIDYCVRENLSYYYLGFYIESCPAMNYKAKYAPNEVADEGRWIRFKQ